MCENDTQTAKVIISSEKAAAGWFDGDKDQLGFKYKHVWPGNMEGRILSLPAGMLGSRSSSSR